MKKIVFFMLLIFTLSYSNSLEKIETLSAKVIESTLVNKNYKEKTYNFYMKYPNKIYKEILSPKINEGEKYIYNENIKSVYYPLLKESYKEQINADENYILQAIKLIKSGKKSVVLEKKEVKSLKLDDNTKIIFLQYKKINGINFPNRVEIYQKNQLYSTIIFKEVKINDRINENLFVIK